MSAAAAAVDRQIMSNCGLMQIEGFGLNKIVVHCSLPWDLSHAMPAWLEYKGRPSRSRIDRRAYNLSEDTECEEGPVPGLLRLCEGDAPELEQDPRDDNEMLRCLKEEVMDEESLIAFASIDILDDEASSDLAVDESRFRFGSW